MAATPPLQEQTFAWLSGITFIVADETIANIGFDFLESGLLQIIGWQQPAGFGQFTGPGASNFTVPAYAKWYDGPLSSPGTGGQYYIKYRILSETGYVGKGSSVTSGTWIAIDDDPPGTTVTRTLVSGGTITETQSNHYINVVAATGFSGFTATAIVNMDIDVGQMVGGSITLLRTIPDVTLHAVSGASQPSSNTFTTPPPTTTTTTAAPPPTTTTTTAAPAPTTTTTTAAPAVTTTTTAAPAVTTTTTAAPVVTTTTTAAPAVTTTTTAAPTTTTTTTAAPTSTTTTTTLPPAKLFTLTNTGEIEIEIQSITFKDPTGIGHVTDLSNLGGGRAVVGDSILSYYLDVGASVTFTIEYYNLSGLAGAPAGNYTGTIVINSSEDTTQTIVNNIIVNSRNITTTTTAAPISTTTTTTTLAPGSASISTTTTTTAPPIGALGFNGKNYVYSGQNATLTLAIYADGTWRLVPTNTGPTPTTYNDLRSWNTITGNWYSPTTPDIGSDYIYWIENFSVTQTGDALVGTSMPTNEWVPFPVTSENVAYVSIFGAPSDVAQATFILKIGRNIAVPVLISTSIFILHGYAGSSSIVTTTTTAAPVVTTTTTAAPVVTTTTTAAPVVTTTTTAAPVTTTTTAAPVVTTTTTAAPSGGGGGGSVSVTAYMPGYTKRAGEFAAGDNLILLNSARNGTVPGTVVSNRISTQNLITMISKSGIRLTCSDNTPLTLTDGSTINSSEALGHQLPVQDQDGFRWEEIVEVIDAGLGQVATIYCEDQCYAAGDELGRWIWTHNLIVSKI